MKKSSHEFRDPVHVFIRLDPDERRVVDSDPFQRLRHIHQLAMTFHVYPGATHRRFEHSLGCMELATRIFDTITRPENLAGLPDEVRERLFASHDQSALPYWRKVLRLAALCHDIGHLPFSHAAEDLLPPGTSHETMTRRLILEEMRELWADLSDPKPNPEQIAKIAVGVKEAKGLPPFTSWETILSEIITGDVFGADRMDYLLRDSLHAGVTYGHFDHHRLIDTMRILPGVAQDNTQDYNPVPELGIEQGGIQVAESLLVARYLMFSQVYFHPVRRIYDLHLRAYLKECLPGGVYPTGLKEFLGVTDNEIFVQMRRAAAREQAPGHEHARRICQRRHFKKVYQVMAQDCVKNPSAVGDIAAGLAHAFGEENIMRDDVGKSTASKNDFPIRANDKIISAHGQSEVMTSLPMATAWFIFAAPEYKEKACAWVRKNLDFLLKPRMCSND
jgi:HD superfamily phosphohydrolase